MRKQLFLGVDVESTMTNKVADFGAVLSDRSGNIIMTNAVLVKGIYDDPDGHCLFHNEKAGALWTADKLQDRYQAYNEMIENGSRVMGSVHSINNWLMMIKAQYDPILYAYNLPFDLGKSRNTGINLDHFNKRFCLWSACVTAIAQTKKYRQFVLENHLFTNRTDYGNMSYRTNAEVMTRYVLGDISIPDEPHQSLEDLLGYEKPLLDKLLKSKSNKWLLNYTIPYNWRTFQVNEWFKPI
jgi:hypothetical protein